MCQLATADTWFRTCRTSSFCTAARQLARFQLTRRIARSLGDSWASCWKPQGEILPHWLFETFDTRCKDLSEWALRPTVINATGRQGPLFDTTLLYIAWSDATESMVTIRSPFCGYNTYTMRSDKGENLSRYSNKIESVSLCPYDHRLTNKAYLSAITEANISRSFHLQDGGKNQLA